MNQKRVIAVLISILSCPFLFFLSASTPPNLLLGDVALYIVAIAFCLLIASKLWRRRRSQIARLGTVPLIVKTRVISFLLFAVVGLLFSLLFWPDIYRATEFSSGTDANSASTVHFCPPPNVRYLGTEYRLRRLDWNAGENAVYRMRNLQPMGFQSTRNSLTSGGNGDSLYSPLKTQQNLFFC